MGEVIATSSAQRRARLRRTPCIGICSTTYGDLVCRGCKRFAHEVVGWNGYSQSQRDIVRARLARLLAESVHAHVAVVDAARLRQAARQSTGEEADAADGDALEALAWRALCAGAPSFAAIGLAPRRAGTVAEAFTAVDGEFYARSRAVYEFSFKTQVQ